MKKVCPALKFCQDLVYYYSLKESIRKKKSIIRRLETSDCARAQNFRASKRIRYGFYTELLNLINHTLKVRKKLLSYHFQ